MGKACSTHGETRYTRTYKDLDVPGKANLDESYGKCVGSMDWIHLAQDRDQLRDLVNWVMNLRVP
jgi:hypothetical protein